MKKKAWAIQFNDIHIKNGNEDDIYEAVKFMVDYCNKYNIRNVICGGDVFDSRSFQRLSHLKCWERCLDLFEVNDIICWCNTGNHDKSLYNSEDNFIDPFKHHPSLKLFSKMSDVNINEKQVTFSPFFNDDLLIPMLREHQGGEVLIGHWSMDGSTHLKSESEKPNLNQKLLSKWNKVFLSHYHNYHKISKDISHLPSLIQDNYGEDNLKGFTVIYDDLSYEVIRGKFREFKKIVIDLNTTSIQSVKELIKVEQGSLNSVRFEFTGDDSKLKTLDKSMFKKTGIDVKLKFNKKYDFDKTTIIPTVVEKYSKVDIENEFKIFCKNKGYNYDIGKSLLDNYFKEK